MCSSPHCALLRVRISTWCVWWRRPVIVVFVIIYDCLCAVKECVVVLNSELHWCACFTTLSQFFIYPFKAQLKVSTVPFCSSIKSLLYRVCALLLYLAFLFYFFIKLHALYYVHGVCFCKQLCSIDRSIDRMICIWFWRLPFTIYIVTFAHTLHWKHQSFFLFSRGWKWEKIFSSMIRNFSIMELLFPFEKAFV